MLVMKKKQTTKALIELTYEYSCHCSDVVGFGKCLSNHNRHLETNTNSDACKYLIADPVRWWRSDIQGIKYSCDVTGVSLPVLGSLGGKFLKQCFII